MAAVTIYASFLIRIWSIREVALSAEGEWQGELQHLQSGRQWAFATFEELVALLHLYAEASAINEVQRNNH